MSKQTIDDPKTMIMHLLSKDPSISLDTYPNGDLIEPQCVQDLLKLIKDTCEEVINTSKEIYLIKDDKGEIDMQDEYVEIREELRDEQRTKLNKILEGDS